MAMSNACSHKAINTKKHQSEVGRLTKYRTEQSMRSRTSDEDNYLVWKRDNEFMRKYTGNFSNRYCFTDNARFRTKEFNVFSFEVPNIYDIFGMFNDDYRTDVNNYIFYLYDHQNAKDPYNRINYEFDETYKYYHSKSYKTPAVLMDEDIRYKATLKYNKESLFINPLPYLSVDTISEHYPEVEVFSDISYCGYMNIYPSIMPILNEQLSLLDKLEGVPSILYDTKHLIEARSRR